MKRLWPFPGDVPLIRARKVALAYRQVAIEQHRAARALRDALDKADKRLLAYDSPATLEDIKVALKAVTDIDPVAALDQRFRDWGETFHAEQPLHYEMDDYVKASEAAKLIHITKGTFQHLRVKGRIKGHWAPNLGTSGGYLYQVRDVYALSNTLRGRGWRGKGPADTLNDNGRSDAE